MQLKRITEGPGDRAPIRWMTFVILRQKLAILTPFQAHFACF